MPARPVIRVWIVALAVVAILLGTEEAFFRHRGWEPSNQATRETWVLARLRVRPQSTVLIGTSRIQTAVDPDVWARVTRGTPPVMLAVAGEGPLQILGHLAADSSFRGHVVAEMNVIPVLVRHADDSTTVQLAEYLGAYREARGSPAKRWEAFLRTNIPNHLVFRKPQLLPPMLIPALLAGGRPRNSRNRLRTDQYRAMNLRGEGVVPNRPAVLDSANFARYMRGRFKPLTGLALDSVAGRIQSEVRQIQARGGRVSFVLLRACGGSKVIEDLIFPSATYWNRLKSVPGVPTFDSDDYPDITGLPCYDGSHVDVSFAPMVTTLIASSLGK